MATTGMIEKNGDTVELAGMAAPLQSFLSAREGARRFHKHLLGQVDPEHCFGDWLYRIAKGDHRGLEKSYYAKAAMTSSTGSLGGYLVPTELRHELFADVAENAIVRPRATVVPMASKTLNLPLPRATLTDAAGKSAFFGGIQFTWDAEASTLAETEPAWKVVTLVAHELKGYALASNPLMADGGAPLDGYLRVLFARAIAWYEDYAFLVGNGSGRPLGVINSGGRLTRSRASATDFKHADAAAMVAMLLPVSWERAIWVMHPLVLAKLIDIGSTTTTTWQANMPGTDSPGVGFLHGRPVFVSEKVSTLGTLGDVILFDPLLYVIGDRLADLEIMVSPDEPTAFLKNQVVFRVVHRVAGSPWLDATCELTDNSTSVSPYVVLS